MIGGKVHTVYRLDDGQMSIVVRGTGEERNDPMTVIDVVDSGEAIMPGDSIWWQDRLALWTPRDRSAEDVRIQRVGYTYGTDTLAECVKQRCITGVCPRCRCADCMHDGAGALWCPACDESVRGEE